MMSGQNKLLDFGLNSSSALNMQYDTQRKNSNQMGYYHTNINSCPSYEKCPTLERKNNCQEHSRDELRIWARNKFSKNGSDPTFQIAMSGATDPINALNPFFYSFESFLTTNTRIHKSIRNYEDSRFSCKRIIAFGGSMFLQFSGKARPVDGLRT